MSNRPQNKHLKPIKKGHGSFFVGIFARRWKQPYFSGRTRPGLCVIHSAAS